MSSDPNEPSGLSIRSLNWRQLGGFVGSGAAAFAVDAAILAIGTRLLGVDPLLARLCGIQISMVVGWLCHRRLTFAVAASPTVREFGRYVGAAWFASLINYAVFAAIIAWYPAAWPQIALVAATSVSMTVSWLAMRYGVFRPTQRA